MNRNYIDYDLIRKRLSEFDDVNWDEPALTFKELCKLRAEQLRQQYNYLILYYSGGKDSATVLNSFLDNNIKLDEIVITTFEGCENFVSINGEIPLQELKLKKYTGKITKNIIKLENVISFLNKKDLYELPVNFSTQLHSFSRFTVQDLEQIDLIPTQTRPKSIGHILGEFDPDIVKMGPYYYARFSIKHDFTASGQSHVIKFFTDKTFPELHVKQCYIAARILEDNPNISLNLLKEYIRDYSHPLLNTTKCSDPITLMKNIGNMSSEANIILKRYSDLVPNFKDMFEQVCLYPQLPIARKILSVNADTFKYYRLTSFEFRTITPSYQ